MTMLLIDENPDDPRRLVHNVEFYITNVCNLNCFNCNRFNNHEFKGYQKWSDYQSIYEKWAQHIKLQRVTILGGEPLLNPTILDWIDGINRLWNVSTQILTNGTRLNSVKGLYNRLVNPVNPNKLGIKNWIGVSLHNRNDLDRCFDEVKKFLHGDVRYYHHSDPANVNNAMTFGATHAFVDSNDVRIPIWEYDSFYRASVYLNANGKFTLHNSDPELAHKGCGFAMFKCYHFIHGALYKCGPVALFPEFDAQHQLDISDQDRHLINSYKPLQVDEYVERGATFLHKIDQTIPQCKFCPEFMHDEKNTAIFATLKKAGSTSGFE
jgi:organic radical activating enzyme